MGNLYISEYKSVVDNGQVQAANEPSVTTQKVSFTTTVASAAFNAGSRFVRVFSDIDAWLVFGDTPVATVSGLPVKAGVPEYFGVLPGQKVAAYDGSSS